VVLKRSRLTFFAAVSLAASAILAAVPFVSPHTPIAPFVVANWLPFIAVAYQGKQNRVIFYIVLAAFALAGWLAVFNAEAIV